jgi:hypothetical protein
MMKKSVVLVGMMVSLSAATLFAKDNTTANGVQLKVDYSGKNIWSYAVSYTSQGNFRQKSSNTAKTTDISVAITASKKQPNALSLAADSVMVKSDQYDAAMQKDLKQKLSGSTYSLALVNGYPTVDSTALAPATQYLSWDLYRQLVRLLPALPLKAVKPGFTWERTVVAPMKTSRGTVTCEIYRTYTFEKVAGDSAFISWKFRYAANSWSADSADALKDIPVYGTGNGSAVLDIAKGCILRAEMNFTTPVAVVGDVSVVWHENAVMKLTGVK